MPLSNSQIDKTAAWWSEQLEVVDDSGKDLKKKKESDARGELKDKIVFYLNSEDLKRYLRRWEIHILKAEIINNFLKDIANGDKFTLNLDLQTKSSLTKESQAVIAELKTLTAAHPKVLLVDGNGNRGEFFHLSFTKAIESQKKKKYKELSKRPELADNNFPKSLTDIQDEINSSIDIYCSSHRLDHEDEGEVDLNASKNNVNNLSLLFSKVGGKCADSYSSASAEGEYFSQDEVSENDGDEQVCKVKLKST